VRTRDVQIIDVRIQELNTDGDGVARVGSDTRLVPVNIPGERVRVRDDRRGLLATLLEVIEPSPWRVAPPCPHFGPCGGCAWQHIAYQEQLRLKTALVQRLVRALVHQAPPVLPTLPAHSPSSDEQRGASTDAAPWGYRQKVHFVFGMTEEGSGTWARGSPPSRTWPAEASHAKAAGRRARRALTMGHYARGSRRVVPVRECPVHDERGNVVAFQFGASLRAAGVEAAAGSRDDARRGASTSVLKSIAVRVGLHTSDLMTTLVVRHDTDKRLRTATRRALQEVDVPTSFHVNLHPRDDRFVFGSETRTISGHARLRESVAGTSFLLSPTAFFQTNVRAAEVLVTLVREAVPAGATVLDLYAGAGLFALPLAEAGHRVTAVEENRDTVADGVASQRLNRIPESQCRFVTQPVETALRRLPSSDVIVLDPPRSGCSAAVIDELCDHRPEGAIVYVSCNPETLARDLSTLTQGGFHIDSIQPVDMFPHTAHVETVAVLRRYETFPPARRER
jgi:23S rRNA (uracil1939-C5)-methyltransferase